MTKPEDIPQWAWEKASDVMRSSPFAMEASDYFDATADLISRAILSAVEEERGACAQIVRNNPMRFAGQPESSIRQALESAIRNRKES